MRIIEWAVAGFIASAPGAQAAVLTALASFNGTNGAYPAFGTLVLDSAGNLLGTASAGGNASGGTVFELVKNGATYSSSITRLFSFARDDATGWVPYGGLTADAAGNLFGTTSGQTNSYFGSVFEVLRTNGVYATSPTVLAHFAQSIGAFPYAAPVLDANGNLFGTTQLGGTSNLGAVYKLAKTNGTYASTLSLLASLNGTTGDQPYGGVTLDFAGNVIGVGYLDGAGSGGTVYEIAYAGGAYSGGANPLVSFSGTGNRGPVSALVADAAGNLFGTTYKGGANGQGMVFEIAKTANGYASSATTLANFSGSNGSLPDGTLLIDAAGDLFGTTETGGTNGTGTVYEILKQAGAYSGSIVTLASFDTTNGSTPHAGLVADSAGILYGTAFTGGTNSEGTIYQVTGSGFVTQSAAVPEPAAIALAWAGLIALVRRRHHSTKPA